MSNEQRLQQIRDAARYKYPDERIHFIDGAKWADSHPAWIPVEEYPKVDISCTLLVHYVDGTIDICDYYGDYYDYTGENVTRNVTHWMPLPTPPQRKEED